MNRDTRKSMRVIKLSRVVETCHYALKENRINTKRLATILNVKPRRAVEILKEVTRMSLLVEENSTYRPNKNCKEFLQKVEDEDWFGVHKIMLSYPYYASFYNKLKVQSNSKTTQEILSMLKEDTVYFNQVTVDNLCDWCERLEVVQRNVLTGKYYAIGNTIKNFKNVFMHVYNSLNVTIGLGMQQRYVEIPKMREIICEELKISRKLFDRSFKKFYLKNIGTIELSGAPFTTHAKKTQKKVKKTLISNMHEKFTTILSSEKYLDGINVNGKAYYYAAYHGGKLYG